MPRQLLFIELNELNFDFVRRYAQDGELPAFETLITESGLHETASEQPYHHLEPWI